MRDLKVIRLIVLSFMGMSVLVFIYGLGFFTDFFQIRSAYRDTYEALQVFNKEIFTYALLNFISIGLLVIMDNHKTVGYSIINKIVGVVTSGFALFQVGVALSQLGRLRALYIQIDPEDVRILYPNYEMSTAAFTFGYIVFALFGIIAVLQLVMTVINKRRLVAQ